MKKIFTLLSVLPAYLFYGGLTSAQQTIYTESFSYPAGGLPPGWEIKAEQPPGWSINNSQISGGTAPELYMTYGMQVGLSRLVSPVINTAGHKRLALSYNQYLINFLGDAGETIGADVTFDGGQTWQTLWEKPLGTLNIPQDRFIYFITVPENATQIQYAFRYDGSNFFINGWAVDDVRIDAVPDKDLLVSQMSGNTSVNAGQSAMLMVEVTNGGQLTQSNYNIKLKSSSGAELASVAGDPISFGEKSQKILTWTPQESDMPQQSVYAVVELSGDENATNDQSRDLAVHIMKDGTKNVQIGSGSFTLQHSIPFNFFNFYSLGQSMYTMQQIGKNNAKITGLQYTCQFDEDNNDIPIQIFLAETDQEDLSSEWLTPSSFTKVFDGKMNFKKGFNQLYIPLQNSFNYSGKNLVVYTNKSHPQMVLWSTFIGTFSEEPIYSRSRDGDEQPFDALNPPEGFPVLYVPNLTLFFEDGTMSVIDDVSKSSLVQVYPNPVTDILKIKAQPNSRLMNISLINSAGQIVLKQDMTENSTELNVSPFPSGYYIAQIETSSGIVSKKILINH